ncbi:MAG: hypothetical protein EKK37_11180 [Sphingobacteriales bacterium]|nr:MAG: hypothetical protein EKK37_11180 [Sphingobacteriales bacterium]
MIKNKIIIVSILTCIGAVAGYVYYNKAGCNNGCMIWSHPWRSTAYGALLGLLLGMAVLPAKK